MSVLVRNRTEDTETKGESCEDGGREWYIYKPGNIGLGTPLGPLDGHRASSPTEALEGTHPKQTQILDF